LLFTPYFLSLLFPSLIDNKKGCTNFLLSGSPAISLKSAAFRPSLTAGLAFSEQFQNKYFFYLRLQFLNIPCDFSLRDYSP